MRLNYITEADIYKLVPHIAKNPSLYPTIPLTPAQGLKLMDLVIEYVCTHRQILEYRIQPPKGATGTTLIRIPDPATNPKEFIRQDTNELWTGDVLVFSGYDPSNNDRKVVAPIKTQVTRELTTKGKIDLNSSDTDIFYSILEPIYTLIYPEYGMNFFTPINAKYVHHTWIRGKGAEGFNAARTEEEKQDKLEESMGYNLFNSIRHQYTTYDGVIIYLQYLQQNWDKKLRNSIANSDLSPEEKNRNLKIWDDYITNGIYNIEWPKIRQEMIDIITRYLKAFQNVLATNLTLNDLIKGCQSKWTGNKVNAFVKEARTAGSRSSNTMGFIRSNLKIIVGYAEMASASYANKTMEKLLPLPSSSHLARQQEREIKAAAIAATKEEQLMRDLAKRYKDLSGFWEAVKGNQYAVIEIPASNNQANDQPIINAFKQLSPKINAKPLIKMTLKTDQTGKKTKRTMEFTYSPQDVSPDQPATFSV